MRLPLPRNRLVQLTLLGAVLTGAVAVGLAAPTVFGADTADDAPGESGNLGASAPTPNPSFTPAVEQRSGEYEEEYEEYGEDDYEDEENEDEHDDDEDEEYDDDDYEEKHDEYESLGEAPQAPTAG